MSDQRESIENKEPINTVVNQPVVDVLNLVKKFCFDNDKNQINSWSSDNLIGQVSGKCYDILVGVKKETDSLKAEIESLKIEVAGLKKNSTTLLGVIERKEAQKEKISQDTMQDIIELKDKNEKIRSDEEGPK